MAEDEPKKLKRTELAKRLAEAIRENDELKSELAKARAQLADRTVEVSDAGSIAEASLKLNDVFTAAQSAADQYLDNIERLYRGRGELVHEAQSKAQAILAQAQLDAEAALSKAKAEAQEAQDRAARARGEADGIVNEASAQAQAAVGQAQEQAQEILAQAQLQADAERRRIEAQAQLQAKQLLASARQKAQNRMDQAERVSRNLEAATKVRCDNLLRRASGEAHVYGDTLRMALYALGITPEMVPALEEATGMKVPERLVLQAVQAEPPLEQPADDQGDQAVEASEAALPPEDAYPDGAPQADELASADSSSQGEADPRDEWEDEPPASDTDDGTGQESAGEADAEAADAGDGQAEGSRDASKDEDPVAALDEAVKSARAAVAAAISNARTEPGSASAIDDDALAAMYPNSARQL